MGWYLTYAKFYCFVTMIVQLPILQITPIINLLQMYLSLFLRMILVQ